MPFQNCLQWLCRLMFSAYTWFIDMIGFFFHSSIGSVMISTATHTQKILIRLVGVLMGWLGVFLSTGCKLRNCEQVWYFCLATTWIDVVNKIKSHILLFFGILNWPTFPLKNHILPGNVKIISINRLFSFSRIYIRALSNVMHAKCDCIGIFQEIPLGNQIITISLMC